MLLRYASPRSGIRLILSVTRIFNFATREHQIPATSRWWQPDSRAPPSALRRACLPGRLRANYTVVMATPVSIRFRRTEVVERLKAEAGARHVSSSALAEELIEEGLRTRRHPLVVFRDGPSGRRAGLVGGPDVWEVIGGLVGGDVPAEARIERAVDVFGLTPKQVGAALDYYADFTTEIDGEIAANLAAADEAEAAWGRRQGLLAR
jgi:hypothetical protein